MAETKKSAVLAPELPASRPFQSRVPGLALANLDAGPAYAFAGL